MRWFRRNKSAEDYIDEIEDALDERLFEEALVLSRKAIRRFPDHPDLWALFGETLAEVGSLEESAEAYGKALELSPSWSAGFAHRAGILLELGRLEDAEKAIDAALAIDPRDPEAHFNLAIFHEVQGDDFNAAKEYRKAAKLDPEYFYLPHRISTDLFEKYLEEAMEELPIQVRKYLHQVPVMLEDIPARDERGVWPLDNPLILAEFRGTPLSDQSVHDPWSYFPAAITIYKKNLERISRTKEDLVAELVTTLLHEVLHFLGLDEDEVAARGLA